jgi:PhzF family phenazine biosynthesis protein
MDPPAAAITAAVTRALSRAPAGAHPPRVANNGPDWLICDLGDEAAVRTLRPDMTALERLSAETGSIGISVFGRAAGSEYRLVVRAFAPADGVPEDPVTGSANAAIGAYLLATGQIDAIGATYRVSQGREIGRDGYVDVCVDAASGEVEIGGRSITSIDGMLALPVRGDG